MSKTDKEKAYNLSCRFRRINLIRSLKDFSIEHQEYEFAAYLRDIERDIEKEHDFDEEVLTLDDVYIRLTKLYEKIRESNSKDYLNSVLREHKIDTILKNPLD